MNRKKMFAAALAAVLCMGMSIPGYAIYDPMKAMEEASRKAVAAAIQAGIVPADTTIYDCAYSTDENGITIVVQYKDKNGNWIDIAAQKPMVSNFGAAANVDTATTTPNPASMTESDLAAYADKVFELTNQEREKAGLPPLERSKTLEEAAAIRAAECASVNSIRVNGQGHTRPDGSHWFTVFGIEKNYNYGENTGEGKPSADIQMASWMNSEGHKKNILREDYTKTGIACAVSEQGEFFAVQIFSRP